MEGIKKIKNSSLRLPPTLTAPLTPTSANLFFNFGLVWVKRLDTFQQFPKFNIFSTFWNLNSWPAQTYHIVQFFYSLELFMHTGMIWLYRYLQFPPLFNINVLSNSVEFESDWYESLKVAMRSRKSRSIFFWFFPSRIWKHFLLFSNARCFFWSLLLVKTFASSSFISHC